jgi:PPM family protein phosphatase
MTMNLECPVCRKSIACAALSDRGRVRKSNQDRCLADPQEQFYAVADGLGGHLAGEVAAQRVVDLLPGRLQAALGDSDDLGDPATIGRVTAAVAQLSRQIRLEGERWPHTTGMGATLVLAIVREERALLVHLGDSRAYLLRNGWLTRLTKDHSAAQSWIDRGLLAPQEAARHPAGGGLMRYVGMSRRPQPEAQIVALQPGDRLLLCSDGLTCMLPDERLCHILLHAPGPQSAADRLIARANAAGGRDNITAVLVDVPAQNESPVWSSAAVPA